MIVIDCDSVDEALNYAMRRFKDGHQVLQEGSRNGPVLAFDSPVTTVYNTPTRRVMLSPVRDANPFFHLMESLWMLAGREDVAFPAHFAKQMLEYSDDGLTLNGAYGYRWRTAFGVDQIDQVIKILRESPNSRRAVVQMWDTNRDLINQTSLDICCNTHIYFKIVKGRLDMTVCCRSNDAVWGAYGANAVHMSMLVEYVSHSIGVPMGVYRQVSDNLHIYPDVPVVNRMLAADWDYSEILRSQSLNTTPLFQSNEDRGVFDEDLFKMFYGGRGPAHEAHTWDTDWQTRFFRDVVMPMLSAHQHYRQGRPQEGIYFLEGMAHNSDWRVASEEWLQRRMKG